MMLPVNLPLAICSRLSLTSPTARVTPLACVVQFAEPCRNLMAADSFYGKTWAGLFKTCNVAYDPNGQKVSRNIQP